MSIHLIKIITVSSDMLSPELNWILCHESGRGLEVYTHVFFSKLDVGLCGQSVSSSGCPVPDERARCPLRGRVVHKVRWRRLREENKTYPTDDRTTIRRSSCPLAQTLSTMNELPWFRWESGDKNKHCLLTTHIFTWRRRPPASRNPFPFLDGLILKMAALRSYEMSSQSSVFGMLITCRLCCGVDGQGFESW